MIISTLLYLAGQPFMNYLAPQQQRSNVNLYNYFNSLSSLERNYAKQINIPDIPISFVVNRGFTDKNLMKELYKKYKTNKKELNKALLELNKNIIKKYKNKNTILNYKEFPQLGSFTYFNKENINLLPVRSAILEKLNEVKNIKDIETLKELNKKFKELKKLNNRYVRVDKMNNLGIIAHEIGHNIDYLKHKDSLWWNIAANIYGSKIFSPMALTSAGFLLYYTNNLLKNKIATDPNLLKRTSIKFINKALPKMVKYAPVALLIPALGRFAIEYSASKEGHDYINYLKKNIDKIQDKKTKKQLQKELSDPNIANRAFSGTWSYLLSPYASFYDGVLLAMLPTWGYKLLKRIKV